MIWSCLILLIAVAEGIAEQTKEHEKRLLDNLLQGYDRRIKPDGIDNETFHLYFDTGLYQIIDVDEKNQVFDALYWQLQRWLDTELSWNPANYSDIKEVHLTDDKIWHANMALQNSIDINLSMKSSATTRLVAYYTGYITRSIMINYRSSCSMNLRQFPFDTQNCTLQFTSARYYANQMNVSSMMTFSREIMYYKNSEFFLEDVETARTVKDLCCGYSVIVLHYHIIIGRRPLFFMLNLMLPCSLITLIAMLSFCIPPDSGEKVGLGLTVLLSLSVFLLIISDQMPPSSEVPLIFIYFFGTVVLVTLSTALAVLVLSIHHTSDQSKEVPGWLRGNCFRKLSRFLCLNSMTITQQQTELNREADEWTTRTSTATVSKTVTSEPHDVRSESTAINNAISQQLLRCFEAIQEYLKEAKEAKREDKQQKRIEQEWRALAQILDRIFLIVFICFNITFTLGILLHAAY